MIKFVLNEVRILQMIKHPNIVKIHEVFDLKDENKDEYYAIIMEYCKNGDLLTYARNNGFKNENEKKKIIKGCLNAIKYLHDNGISHGDIKSENILLDEKFTPKLCDFGFSRTKKTAGEESKNGTLYYAAPELFLKGHFDTFKTDIYAIGIMLYSISELEFPFKNDDPELIVKQIIKGNLSIRKGIDLNLRNLIEKCTNLNPQNRPTIDDIIRDDYFIEKNLCDNKNNDLTKECQKVDMSFY